MDPKIQMIIELATGVAYDQFRTEHPATAAELEAIYITSAAAASQVFKALQQGPEYAALVAQTNAETSIVQLAGVIGPMVLQMATKLMGV